MKIIFVPDFLTLILFFLGILTAVSAFQSAGHLSLFRSRCGRHGTEKN